MSDPMNYEYRALLRLIATGSIARSDNGVMDIPDLDQRVFTMREKDGLKVTTEKEIWHRGAEFAPEAVTRWTLDAHPDSIAHAKELLKRRAM
jgi:hypothetical protein